MRLKSWIFPYILMLTYSCASIKPDNIKYNTSKKFFEFVKGKKAITLRNDNNLLVDSTNIDAFQLELLLNNNHYPFIEKRENDDLLKKSDFRLAQHYSDVNSAIKNKDYQKALNGIVLMRCIYPTIDYYSDCSFLEGLTWEKLEKSDRAATAYQKFITLSDKKYSSRFRGHRDTDNNDSMYIVEKNYAFDYLNHTPDSLKEGVIKPIQPEYYYTSNQPGFTINPEDFSKDKNHLQSITLGLDEFDDLSVGYQISCGLKNTMNLNAMVFASNNMYGLGFSIPFQLYKSKTNNFGIKISPFVKANFLHRVQINGKYEDYNGVFINFGSKVSAAYYFNQKLYLGSYFNYNFYNEENKFNTRKSDLSLWSANEYDFSGYYTILKNISLKVGVKNSDIVAGFYFGGLEISYNITNSGILLRSDFF